jgi:protein SCO1/2
MKPTFAFLLLAAALIAADGESLNAGAFDPPRAAPDFSQRGSDGATVELSRFRGKVVVLYFGFSSCPKVCPTTLATLAEARKKLGDEGKSLQIVYVTVDPERDDAERLRKYLAGFDPTFVGGTGSEEQLEAARRAFGILAAKQTSGSDYTFSHSSYTYLIDRKGNLRALMPYGQPSDAYVHDVRILLEQ